MLEPEFLEPLSTEQTSVEYADETLRLECNQVRNKVTNEVSTAVRLVQVDAARYAIVTIPVLPDGRLILYGRYRYAIGRWSLEFPRSTIDTTDVGWRTLAEENLLRDTGLESDDMRLLGAIQLDPELMSMSVLVVLAEGCSGSRAFSPDPGSLVAGRVALTPEELDQLIRGGEIVCATTLSALYLCRFRRR